MNASGIHRLANVCVCFFLTGLISCAEESQPVQKPSPGGSSTTGNTKPDTAGTALQRIVQGYGIGKQSKMKAAYDLGYQLFVVTEKGVAPTGDATTLYDYRIDWRAAKLSHFSDSAIIVQFGGIVDLNEAGQSVSALPAHITNEPGSLRNLALEPGAGFSATITCETLLADSSGIVCALGFSTRR